MPKTQTHSVGDIARILKVAPRRITSLFYERRIPDDDAPIVSGTRLVPASMIPIIAGALEARGVVVNRDALAAG